MKMYDCDICYSAGSVNQWGWCEVCGERVGAPRVLTSRRTAAAETASRRAPGGSSKKLAAVGQGAA